MNPLLNMSDAKREARRAQVPLELVLRREDYAHLRDSESSPALDERSPTSGQSRLFTAPGGGSLPVPASVAATLDATEATQGASDGISPLSPPTADAGPSTPIQESPMNATLPLVLDASLIQKALIAKRLKPEEAARILPELSLADWCRLRAGTHRLDGNTKDGCRVVEKS